MALHVAFVGMSNIGKTFWSKKLEDRAFKRICIDDLIAENLKPTLKAAGYGGSTEDVADWMGLPHEERSPANQARYLQWENFSLLEVLLTLPKKHDVVIDTTGSIPHLSLDAHQLLKKNTIVVEFETPASRQEIMLRQFIDEPKPVFWGKYYVPINGEKPAATIARCYPLLLAARNSIYNQLAHLHVPYVIHKSPAFTAHRLHELIELTKTRLSDPSGV